MADKNRPLHILKYLWDHTDEEHLAREKKREKRLSAKIC